MFVGQTRGDHIKRRRSLTRATQGVRLNRETREGVLSRIMIAKTHIKLRSIAMLLVFPVC